jgi:RING finger/CHY zinc finger protein 1
MRESRKQVTRMICGHWIHLKCIKEYVKSSSYTCPLCSKYIIDMSEHEKYIDEQIQTTPMPSDYNTTTDIICNECTHKSNIKYHFYGLKCPNCFSYNTKRIQITSNTSNVSNTSNDQIDNL